MTFKVSPKLILISALQSAASVVQLSTEATQDFVECICSKDNKQLICIVGSKKKKKKKINLFTRGVAIECQRQM